MAFDYSELARPRRHGPRGYLSYGSYKPWIRDEFAFRCIYCLCRETWFPDGEASFSVDHLRAQAEAPTLTAAYENLAYACNQCNAYKLTKETPDPCRDPYGKHLEVKESGAVVSLTPLGENLIETCRLNRPQLIAYRREMIVLLAMLLASRGRKAQSLLLRYVGFPVNLPDLSALRPPGGNDRPDGIADCYFERKRRGELTATY